MKFLEARRTVQEFKGGEPLQLLIALSGSSEPFALYLEAASALQGRSAVLEFLPFGTLQQYLVGGMPARGAEVVLLLPWDFVPESDWRSGVAAEGQTAETIQEGIARMGRRLAGHPRAAIFYLAAPIAPVWLDPERQRALEAGIQAEALAAGARLLSPDAFSLASYLATGCPIGGGHLGTVATEMVTAALAPRREPKKVLITDFDNVLWSGVLAEDGIAGIAMGPDAAGYGHFIYQSLLLRLRRDGVLLAGVTRNAPEIVAEVFKKGRMPLAESDFVTVLASYGAKSSQIKHLAQSLNLGLDSFVFVDDNPVELAEVAMELPGLLVRPFPARVEGIPDLVRDLAEDFGRKLVTVEDRERTELYRRRLQAVVPSEAGGGDLTDFLRGLGMTLSIHDRSTGDRARVIQLINKTNQFNLNGRRVEDAEVAAILEGGGRLYGASLEDRTGSHGEILACLVDAGGTIRSFVLSCRVLQRRVEHAFLAWVCARPGPPRRLDFAETARNEPFRIFLRDPAFVSGPEGIGLDSERFVAGHADSIELFTLREPGANE